MISKLDLYKIYCQVGKHKSFSKAGKELFMTQPAVSQAMKQLENELDIRLFTRTPKGVTFTNEGQLLFEYVQSAINLIKTGEEKIAEFKNLSAGELKIGVGDTISRHFLLPYLEIFHTRYPNIKFKIVNGTTLEMCALLKSGTIDVAICNFPIEDPSLEQIPCLNIHDIFVCGQEYKKHIAEPLPLEKLVEHPLILLEPKSNSRKYMEDFLRMKGMEVAPEFELGSHDLLLEFAKMNLGIACVTKEFSQDYLEKGLLYEVGLTERIPARNVGICYLKSVPLSTAALKFVEVIEGNRTVQEEG